MSIKRILAAAAASVVAVSSMAVVASADGFSGSVTVNDTAWWTEETICIVKDGDSISKLIGDVDPDNVASITFSSDTEFKLGYNVDADNGHWYDTDPQKEFVVEDIALNEDAAVKVAISKGDGVDYTINWTVALKEGDAAPADPEPAPADPEPAPADPEPAPADPAPANNVDTGVEGVAAVLGVAAVAAGAMIVAKKRK